MATAPIAGPRRVRPVTAPPEPKLVAPAAAAAPAPAMPSGRPLQPLDYDETASARAQQLESTQPGRRRRAHRLRWFVLGIAFGAVAAVAATGDARGTLQAARSWSANALRSLEHRPAAAAAPSSMATTTPRPGTKYPWETPCPIEPAADDPCAELLAPFAGATPPARPLLVVRVEDLPQAQPTVVIVARRHRAAPASAGSAVAPASSAPATNEEQEEAAAPPAGNDPYADDPQASPTKAAPAASPPPAPVERPVQETPSTELKTARNEP